MKNKKILLLSLTSLLGSSALMAQIGQWKLTGNNLNGTQKLGSTNNFSLDFITNNVKRMSLTSAGNAGIGTTAPLSKLHVKTGTSGIAPFFQSVITAESSSSAYINVLAPSANETGILFGNSLSNVSGGIIYNSAFQGSAPNALQFRTNSNLPRMVLTAGGNLGIGTTTPKASLHVFRGSAGGAAPNIESPIVAEANGNAFINLLTPLTKVSGILFGNNANVADGGIVYSGGQARMEFRSDNNTTRLVLQKDLFGSNTGLLGINTTPDVDLHLVHPAIASFDPHGLRIHHISQFGNTSWLLYTESNGNLELYRDNNISSAIGRFDGVSGAYTPLSDARMKKDIEKAPYVLEKVLQLNIKKYHFLKNKTEDKKYYGMIAQEVEKIFPEIVYHNKIDGGVGEYYTMDYSAFGVIAIKAIQELVKIDQEKDEKVNKLEDQVAKQQKQIDELQAIVFKGIQSSGSSQALFNNSLTDAALEQNTPNPFANATIIHYILPQKFTRAQIIITDKTGKTLKQINVSGAGKGVVNVDASSLSSGTYNYSLIVDGKLIETRQMEHLK